MTETIDLTVEQLTNTPKDNLLHHYHHHNQHQHQQQQQHQQTPLHHHLMMDNNNLHNITPQANSSSSDTSRPTSPNSVLSVNSASSSNVNNHNSVHQTPIPPPLPPITMRTVIDNHGSILNFHGKKTTPTKTGTGNSNRMSMAITNNNEIDILFSQLKNSITSKNSFILGIHRHRSISNTTTLTSFTDQSPSNIISSSDINSDTLGRASAITITNSDIISSDSNAGALNQPSFNELTITCDTLTETDEEEDLGAESFLEDDDDDQYQDDEDHDYIIEKPQHKKQPQHQSQQYQPQLQQQPQQDQPIEEGEEFINEKEFMKFQKQFLHHTNSSSSFIRTPQQQQQQYGGVGSSLNLSFNKSVIGGSLLDNQQQQHNNSRYIYNNISTPPQSSSPFITSPDDTNTDSSSINESNSSFKSTQNSVIYKPSLSSLSSSLISATPNSLKGSPFMTSPMISPRLLSVTNNNNNNVTDQQQQQQQQPQQQPQQPQQQHYYYIAPPNSTPSSKLNQPPQAPQTPIQSNLNFSGSTSTSTTAGSTSNGQITVTSPTPITAASSTSSTSLLSTSSSSNSSSSNTSSPKPSKKSKSVFSKIIKEGTKRLVTKFSDSKKDSPSQQSDSEDSPISYILVYRGNGDESWKVKINQNTTVKELLTMLSQPSFLKLYLSNSLNTCNCNNNNQNSNCNINNTSEQQSNNNNNHNSSSNSNSNKCNICNQPKIIEKELNDDDKILYVQKKWISSGTTSTPPLFVLKSNNSNNNSNNCTTSSNNGTLYNNNSISKNTAHYLLNSSNINSNVNSNSNNYSGRYSMCSLTSESSDYSNSSHASSTNQMPPSSLSLASQQQQNESSPWSSPSLQSLTPKSNNPLMYNPNLQHIMPNFNLDNRNSIIYTPNSTASAGSHSNSSSPSSNSFLLSSSGNDHWKKSEKPRSGIRWINSADINLLKNIGSGSFSKVYKAKYMGEVVAVKILNGDITPEQIENFKKEYDVLSLISSPHLIKFYGACKENKLKMVVEYCQHGSLYNMMSHKKKFELAWPLLFKWMRQAVEGINVLHTMKPALVHRDIKSQNLLINSQFDLKVADFGLAKPTELQTNSSTLKGTMAYCAPELYSNVHYTEKSDVYSLGIVLWELTTRCLTGRYHRPYEDHTGISFDFQIVIMTSKQGIRPTMPENVPPKLSGLITKCWHQDPQERPNCEQVLLAIQSLYDDYISDPNYWNSLIAPHLISPNSNSNNSNYNNNNINYQISNQLYN
ncbi:protein kinase [Tieghemostelium lacteum]|uniref:Protein kinase n=1 Tax=Tieghemostelium lacteum TaxID=361077 RepID=A0A151Z7Q5_TIELA|nr:protein kinase [Tieghemostelium lacteum]|eukprot:KYQ89999.1 protein kinase [Tieghemostelium lacteum]